ncbi:MAG: NAD(P)-dependent oxidoreductase [Bryobacteraceae bacterium]|nr:NAD(P)-dependent oxidoreductase [Bryobacteraceae bacterium]
MRALITGGSGFVGGRLAAHLAVSGVEVTRVLRKPPANQRPDTFLADIREFTAVRRVFQHARPDVVFHCAMTYGHPTGADDRLESLSTSVIGTANLAEAAAEAGVKRFVHLGSFLGYQPQVRAITESDPIGPLTPRGAAKAAASLWLRQFALANAFPAVELRIFSVYGPGEPPRRFIPSVLRAARTGTILPLLAGPSHDFVFVDDVVDACLRAASFNLTPGSVYNIAGGKAWKNEEVVEAARDVTGRPIDVAVGAYPRKPADEAFWLADISLAAEQLGWKPAHTFHGGLRETFLCPN